MNKQQIKLFASKKSDNWRTPIELYNKLNNEFNFDFDPCPYKSEFNGLTCEWGLSNFVNPPYSNVTSFLKKAHYELYYGKAKICVFLLFSNTDTRWFHNYIYNIAELRFIKGRLKFISDDIKKNNTAMRPSMVCILKKENALPIVY